MKKEIINTPNAPAAVGPYSHAVKFGNSLYISGQIAINPKSGEIPKGIEAQTKQTFENIKAILKAADFSLSDVVLCDVYLKDMNDFGAMNKVYADIFDPVCPENDYPARATVEVARLPKDCLVEIKVSAMQ